MPAQYLAAGEVAGFCLVHVVPLNVHVSFGATTQLEPQTSPLKRTVLPRAPSNVIAWLSRIPGVVDEAGVQK
jgi:hypothetical protein